MRHNQLKILVLVEKVYGKEEKSYKYLDQLNNQFYKQPKNGTTNLKKHERILEVSTVLTTIEKPYYLCGNNNNK